MNFNLLLVSPDSTSSLRMSQTNRLKISHDIEELAGSSEGRVLVMKDKSVLEDDESDIDAIEVEDLELAAAEREAKRKRLAGHGKAYDPLDPEHGNTGLLSKYDDFDEIEKQREKSKQIDLNVGLSRISAMNKETYSRQAEYDDSVELPSSMRIQGAGVNSYFPTHGLEERLKFQSDFYEPGTGADSGSGGFKKVKKEKKKRKIEKSDDENNVKIKVEDSLAPIHTAIQDDELYAQLARLRRQKVASTRVPVGAEYIAKTVQRDVAMETQMTSSMIDFISRIDTVDDGEDHKETVEETPIADIETGDTVMIEKETVRDEPAKRDAALVEEVVVDSGLAGALKFFQSRGFVDSEDNRPGESSDDDIHLERRDEFGRSITDPKEAFKQLSWRFHGKKPGAKKQEKRLRKLENESKSLKNQ